MSGMAITVERTATEDITAALAALDVLTRFTGDARAHLEAAQRQDPIAPDTLDAARHAARIVAACAASIELSIRDARLRAAGIIV